MLSSTGNNNGGSNLGDPRNSLFSLSKYVRQQKLAEKILIQEIFVKRLRCFSLFCLFLLTTHKNVVMQI
jgi:hypothetical protein